MIFIGRRSFGTFFSIIADSAGQKKGAGCFSPPDAPAWFSAAVDAKAPWHMPGGLQMSITPAG
ncbi:hypothetical protein I4100191B2_01290 [Clostridiales bacterium]